MKLKKKGTYKCKCKKCKCDEPVDHKGEVCVICYFGSHTDLTRTSKSI